MTLPIVPGRTLTGQQLRRARERAGLSQTDVARFLGVRPQRIGNVEREAHPTPQAVAKILAAISAILRGDGPA